MLTLAQSVQFCMPLNDRLFRLDRKTEIQIWIHS